MSRKVVLVLCAAFALAVGVATASARDANSANLALSSDVVRCPGYPASLCFGTLNGNGLAPTRDPASPSLVTIQGFRSDGTLGFTINRLVDGNGRIHFVGNLSCGEDSSQFVNFSASATAADGTTITTNVIATAPC